MRVVRQIHGGLTIEYQFDAVVGDGDRAEATINFGSLGEKRLLLRYAPVEKL